MNKGYFGLGLGSAAVVIFAILGLATPITAQAGVCNGTALPDFGIATSAPLQDVFDSHTVPGPTSSVSAATDCFPDGADSVWQIGSSGGSVMTIIVEFAGFAGSNIFGLYDAANPSQQVEIFSGADFPGGGPGVSQKLISILADGSVFVDAVDSMVDLAANAFGFYLDATVGNQSPDGLFHSDTSLNADGMDHMYVYNGVGDGFQIPPFIAGPWNPGEYILAWEDLIGPCRISDTQPVEPRSADCDYTDFVVMVESVSPVPEPTSLAIVGIGLLGLGAANRRWTRKS